MKKSMLFLVLLFLVVGGMAQVDTGREYRIKNSADGTYLNVLNHETHTSGAYGGVNVAELAVGDSQIFTFEASGSGYKIKCKDGYYITCHEWNVDANSTTTGTVLMLEEVNAAEMKYRIKWPNTYRNNQTLYFKVGASNDKNGNFPYCDAEFNASAVWVFEAVDNAGLPYTVKVLGTNSAAAGVSFKGQTYGNGVSIAVEDAVTKSDFTATAIAGMFAVVNIDGTTVYVSYFDENTKFYTIRNKKAGYVSTNADYVDNGALLLNNTNAPRDNKGLWTFVQQENNVYKIYNFSTGLSKVLGMTGSEANARATMVDPSASAYTTNFTGRINFDGSTASYIKLNGTSNNYWNLRGNYLALWDDARGEGDDGSTFYIKEVDYTKYPDVFEYKPFSPKNPNTLWYRNEASVWQEYALPLGNGELGCMVFGGAQTEQIQFNEKTLWSGPANTVGVDSGKRTFVSFGSLYIVDNDYDPYVDYVRYLDIEEGIAGVEYENSRGEKQVRRYLSSAPDQVIAGQYTIDNGGKLNLTFKLEAGRDISAGGVTYENGMAMFSGAMEAVKYAARLHVVAEGATIETASSGITVKNATKVTFYLKGATNFDGNMDVLDNYFTNESAADVNNRVKNEIDAAVAKGFDAVEAAHIADFTALTKRMTFDLGLATPTVDTKTLVDNYYPKNLNGNSTANDHLFLEQLYFHYGRYLAISSNRKPIAAPNNLQGIWNNLGRADSPWNSDIHTNINIQMNYWPTEVTNLSELHKPFVNFIIRGAKSAGWKKVGEIYNNGYGWSVLTESSLYNSMSTWGSNYLVANVWYASHLWTHWRYTQDKEYLKKAFPVMWSCAEFWFHRLKKVNGKYLAPNEYSPEHGPGHGNTTGEDGTAHAQQMISYLFESIAEAVEILGAGELGLKTSDVEKLNDYLANTDKGLATEVCAKGYNGVAEGTVLLREWKTSPHTVGQLGHRHMSHLMALFPMEQITPESEFFTPAVNSLRHRGDEATGWSMGWKVNLWARAQDGDHAHIIIKNALKHSTSYGQDEGAGGIYYNLFDSHAPFQIDGNFGVCSGIAEMLMQSAHGYINVLPALPAVWQKTGKVTGMKAVGNFTVDFNWEEGKCQAIKIVSNAGAKLRVRCNIGAKALNEAYIAVNGAVVSVDVDENGIAVVPCEKGDVVEIKFVDVPENIDVTGIALDNTEVTLAEGETITLTATVTPADATDKTVTWSSSDATVATVEEGVVMAVAAGSTFITAQAGEMSAVCAVTVEAANGIDNAVCNGKTMIYDLKGNRVEKLNVQKQGVYIINGAKKVVK